MDILGTFNSGKMSTLIFHLLSLQIPPKFCNIIFSLFSNRNLLFSSSFGSRSTRSTFSGLLQRNCLSFILFYIYTTSIANYLSRLGYKCLIYVYYIVVFSSNKSLNIAVESLNLDLDELILISNSLSFSVAFDKCKFVIFIR